MLIRLSLPLSAASEWEYVEGCLKMGHSRPLFFFIFVFSIQLTVNVRYKFLPMTGFEPRTSGIGSDRSTNWATTTAKNYSYSPKRPSALSIEWSLLILEDPGSNQAIVCFLEYFNSWKKSKIKKKMALNIYFVKGDERFFNGKSYKHSSIVIYDSSQWDSMVVIYNHRTH